MKNSQKQNFMIKKFVVNTIFDMLHEIVYIIYIGVQGSDDQNGIDGRRGYAL